MASAIVAAMVAERATIVPAHLGLAALALLLPR
jgi:hypothetical protein